MSTCSNCGGYYRLSKFHNDPIHCEDCSVYLPRFPLDEDSQAEIETVVNPSGKTAPVRYEEVIDELEQ